MGRPAMLITGIFSLSLFRTTHGAVWRTSASISIRAAQVPSKQSMKRCEMIKLPGENRIFDLSTLPSCCEDGAFAYSEWKR